MSMKAPHVVSLRYKLLEGDEIRYRDASAVERDAEAFSVRLDDGILIATMKEHFASVLEARAVVEPFLRAWEIHQALIDGRRGFGFKYESARVVDREPAPGRINMQAEATGTVVLGGSVSIVITRSSYPDPPSGFAASPNVEALWTRYQRFLDGKEPLLAVSYFVLTFLDAMAGGRRKIQAVFDIERKVIRELGKLSSERGGPDTARKMPRSGTHPPLNEKENRWLSALLPKLIRQVGERDAGKVKSKLAMTDLPPM